jgi:hypothetical protein
MPGIAASTRLTLELAALPNSVEDARKQFRVARDLGVDFQSDDDLPVACGTGNQAFGIWSAGVDEAHGMLIFLDKDQLPCRVEQSRPDCKAFRAVWRP